MIPVTPNTFFLKNTPPSGSMIPIVSEMGDLPLSASSTLLSFSSGDINQNYLVSGNINNELTDGQYNLIGGYLRTFSSGASVTNTGQAYNLSTYIFKESFPVGSGGFTLDTGESIYNVNYGDGGNIYGQEDFEGANTSLDFQLAPISGYFGNEPYIWYDDAVDAYADKYLVTRQKAKHALKPYRTFDPKDQPGGSSGIDSNTTNNNIMLGDEPGRDWQIGGVNGKVGRRGGGVARIYLTLGEFRSMSVNGKKLRPDTNGFWYPKIKRADNSVKTSSHIKIPRKHIASLIRYGSMYKIDVVDEAEERQTTNNTIFDSVYSAKMVHNPWNADLTNPLVVSYLNISKVEGKRNNAARFYHSWGFASGSQGADGGKTAIEVIYGRTKDLNGQTIRASVHNIPIPLVTDVGNDDRTQANDRRTYVPEISMDMRIDKMGATPFYGITQNPAKYSKDGMYTGSASNEVIVYGKGYGTTLDTRIDNATDTITTWGDNKTESFLRSVVITFSNYTPDDVSSASDNKPNVTLDEFLNYGLDNFYIKGQTKHGIVGGVSFKTYGSISGDTGAEDAANTGVSYPGLDSSSIFAQALPVTCKSSYDMPASSGPSESLFRYGGMMRLCDGAYDMGKFDNSSCNYTLNSTAVTMSSSTKIKKGMTVSSATAGFQPNTFIKEVTSPTAFVLSANWTGSTGGFTTTFVNPDASGGISPQTTGDDYLLKIGAPSWIDSYGGTGNSEKTWAAPPLWQRLSFNSFFKLRFFWDILSVTDNKVYSNTPYSDLNNAAALVQNAQGPLCRLIIEPEGGGTETDVTTDLSHPFIDIPFPMAASDSTSLKTRRWSPLDTETGQLNYTLTEASGAKLWPQCMTIWVNNYRYVVGGSNTRRETSILNGQSDDYFYYGDSSPTGADQEIEMFLDNITIKDFTPEVQNMTKSNTRPDTWAFTPTTVESPLYTINGFGLLNENARWLTSFNAVSGTNAAERNAASFSTRYPSQSLIFGWNNKTDMPINATNRASGYCLFSDFSTNNFNDLNQFNFPQWSNYAAGGFISMASNVVTNDLDRLGHQYMGAHCVSGTSQSQYTETAVSNFNNLSGSLYSIVDAAVVGDNKMTIASGTNTFLSTDAFTQKGFININVSGAAGDDTTVDYGNWGKREHAGVSVKVVGFPRGDSGLGSNQIEVQDTRIFNEFQADEYIIYRAHAADATSTRKTGLKLASAGAIKDNVITFTEDVTTSDAGGNYMGSDFHSEIYISPYKYWVTMNYANAPLYGALNNKLPTSRSYSGIGMVNETPVAAFTGSTLNESVYSYDSTQIASVGRSGMYNQMWDFDIDEDDSVFELGQDFGFGAYDPETMMGGEVDIRPVLSGNYVDINMSGPVGTNTIQQNTDFLAFIRLNGKDTDGSVSLYSPSNVDFTTKHKVPRFYWQYADVPPTKPVLQVEPAKNTLADNINLYALTDENLNAVQYNWDEVDEDIWYRYMIMATGNISNKYEGARLWIPLNEEPLSQDLSATETTHSVYDVVSGTSTSLQNAGNGNGAVLATGGVLTGAFQSELVSDLTGVAGWAPVFTDDSSGTYAFIPSGGNFSFPMEVQLRLRNSVSQYMVLW